MEVLAQNLDRFIREQKSSAWRRSFSCPDQKDVKYFAVAGERKVGALAN
jgi:hypothetical protein